MQCVLMKYFNCKMLHCLSVSAMATAAAGKQDDGVSFVDFKPRVIDAGSKYSTPKYEDFR